MQRLEKDCSYRELTEEIIRDRVVCGAIITRKLKRNSIKAKPETKYPKSMKTSTCKNCGRKHGVKQECPAQGKFCFTCIKPNHYSRMCRSKAVHECDLFIGVVKNEGEDEVSVKLVIENFHSVKVKLDTRGPS